MERTIIKRRSCCDFEKEELSKEELAALLTAAAQAPVFPGSREHIQLIVVCAPEILDQIDREILTAEPSLGPQPSYQAATLVIVCARQQAWGSVDISRYDALCILESMMQQTVRMNLGAAYYCSISAPFDFSEGLRRKLKMPEDLFMVAAFASGYPELPLEKCAEEHGLNVQYI